MKKVLKTIKRIFQWTLALAFFAFAIFMTILVWNINKFGVSQINDYSVIILKNKITSDKYSKGDIVIVEKKNIEDLTIDEEIFAYQVNAEKVVSIDVGKIGHIHTEENAISFVNGSTYDMDFTAGSAIKTIDKWGYVLSIIMSKWGFLFIILVPIFVIFVYEIYALIIEIKYGKDDEEENKEVVNNTPQNVATEELKSINPQEENKEVVNNEIINESSSETLQSINPNSNQDENINIDIAKENEVKEDLK